MKLTADQISEFHREGYLVVEGLLDDSDLQPVIDEISEEVDQRARELVASGELSEAYDRETFETRLIHITAESDKVYRALVGGQLAGPGVFGLLTNPKLLDLVEQLVGQEIIAASAYRLRPKIPDFGAFPWHQDSGFFEPYCDKSLILTVWLPLVDATPERGCMQVIPRVHRGDVLRHHHTPVKDPGRADARTLEIVPDCLPASAPVTVPVRKGGVLLFTNRTPHRSIDNVSDVVRWSFDLRYQPADLPTNYRSADGQPFHLHHDDEEPLACYPPEADFLVRSARRPSDVVADWHRFNQIRMQHERAPATVRWD